MSKKNPFSALLITFIIVMLIIIIGVPYLHLKEGVVTSALDSADGAAAVSQSKKASSFFDRRLSENSSLWQRVRRSISRDVNSAVNNSANKIGSAANVVNDNIVSTANNSRMGSAANVPKDNIVSTANTIGSAANVVNDNIVSTANNSRMGSVANVPKDNIVSTANNSANTISKTSNSFANIMKRKWNNMFG